MIQRHEQPSASGATPGGVAVLFENPAWLGDLFAGLGRRSIPHHALDVRDAAFRPDDLPAWGLLLNRVSPSSYLRGHEGATGFALALLRTAASAGLRVINGARSFEVETSKVEQVLLLRRLGVQAPRTLVLNGRRSARALARDLSFPAILKPDMGGSGAYVRRVASLSELEAILAGEPDLFAPDHVLLLQEYAASRDGTIVRLELVDGELVCAMRVRPVNTFNLCPAEACERPPADPSRSAPAPSAEFEPYPDVPPDAVAQAREIVRAAGLDVGGVEYVETGPGERVFLDINATSVYRRDVCRALGIDADAKLIDFVERELAKERVKRVRYRAVDRRGSVPHARRAR